MGEETWGNLVDGVEVVRVEVLEGGRCSQCAGFSQSNDMVSWGAVDVKLVGALYNSVRAIIRLL